MFAADGVNLSLWPIPLTNGQASLTLTTYSLFTGVNHVSAEYLGDTNYRDSTSNSLTVTGNEGDFSISLSNPNLVIPSGGSGTAILTTASSLGLGGTVSLACATTSPSIACALSPSSFSLPTSGAQKLSAVEIDTHQGEGHSESSEKHKAAPGQYKVVITATDAGVVHTLLLNVTVQ